MYVESGCTDAGVCLMQALNSMLLTAPELKEVRKTLKETLTTLAGRDLYLALHRSWCHAPVATISLCLLAQVWSLVIIYDTLPYENCMISACKEMF